MVVENDDANRTHTPTAVVHARKGLVRVHNVLIRIAGCLLRVDVSGLINVTWLILSKPTGRRGFALPRLINPKIQSTWLSGFLDAKSIDAPEMNEARAHPENPTARRSPNWSPDSGR
jgi:hypothetical protein